MDVPPKIYEAAGEYEVFAYFSVTSTCHKLQIQGMHHLTKINDLVICNQRDCFSTRLYLYFWQGLVMIGDGHFPQFSWE